MSMVSPFKLFEHELNSFKINANSELGHELREFFKDPANDYLWQLSTNRQTTTHALRYTESIPLRYLKGLPKGSTTIEANQHMEVTDSKLADIPVFRKTIEWFESALAATGCSRVEFGRIFASKLAGKQGVDLHTDEGKYFSYYDRFHFTVTAAPENLFVIRDEECVLEQNCLYWVNNHVPHWLDNTSTECRINFIIDARLI
jgi:hypothetical protein